MAELSFEKKDGTKFRGEISSNILDQHNGQSSSVSIVRNITERKNAEMALEESKTRRSRTDSVFSEINETGKGLSEFRFIKKRW